MNNTTTLERPTKAQAVRAHLTSPVVQILGFVAALFAASGGSAAYADTGSTDLLNGGGDGIFTQLGSYLTGTLTGKVFALAVISIAIGLVLKWVRKAVHA